MPSQRSVEFPTHILGILGPIWFPFLKNFENTKNIILVFFEFTHCSLNLVFYVYVFEQKHKKGNQMCYPCSLVQKMVLKIVTEHALSFICNLSLFIYIHFFYSKGLSKL